MNQEETDYNFIKYFYENIAILHNNLLDVFKSKELIKDHFLATKGFMIRRYELKNITVADTDIIRKNLRTFIANEEQLKSVLIDNKQKLKNVSLYYIERNDEIALNPDKLLVQFNNAVDNARLAIVRIDQLTELNKLKKGQNVDAKIKIILSLEKMLNQVVILTGVAEQIYKYTTKIMDLLTPFDIPVVYGRVMSKKEFDTTLRAKRLSGNKDLVPVFDCPKSIQNNIIRMNRDTRKNFFKEIGVNDSSVFLIFQTKTKPVNVNTPIPQSNGLKEFKFINGTEIEILKAA